MKDRTANLEAIRKRYLGKMPNAAHDVVSDIVTLLEVVNYLDDRLAAFKETNDSLINEISDLKALLAENSVSLPGEE